MEVVPMSLPRSNSSTGTVGLPFNRRNVEEWSRLDRLTGIMETAKIETDHWAARSNNAAHNYGKVIDSRERNNPDGSLHQRQRKQMEVFQTKVPGGSMQVIRTQTITTSSKKWTTTNEKGFEDLELPVNSLDLSSQKTKGSVGRSGSIGGRRPPSRPRSLISQSSNTNIFGEESSVSRLCQRLHEQARREMFKGFSDFTNHNKSFNGDKIDSDVESDRSGVVITDVTNEYPPSEESVKSSLTRQKSCSNENITVDADNENHLRRSSKVRRSLQFHKQSHSNAESDSVEEFDWSTTKSLKERAAEIENLLRRGSSTYASQSTDRTPESFGKVKSLKTRDSFVSAETLKEVRDRLKKHNSSDSEMKDDGIVTEKDESSPSSKVKCFVYGMESMINGTNKKPNINGTGSLESRSSNRNSVNASRSSEWYRRRKSYGFEQVDEPEKFDKFNNKKCHIDSSTDSGICQSSETMGIPSWSKNLESSWNNTSYGASETKTPLSTTVVTVGGKKDINDSYQPSVPSRTANLYDKAVHSIYLDNPSEVFSVRIEDSKKDDFKKRIFKHGYNDDPLPCESVWTRKSPIPVHKVGDINRENNLKSSLRSAKNPWLSQLRGTKLVDRNWASDEQEDSEEAKRQSDSSEKLTPPLKEDGAKPEMESVNQKKSKKVEFCKTEVHFAAESGKFNIVETDGKPPPNDIFRSRRRRISGSSTPKNPNGLPETKFGVPSFEKRLLTATENTESISEKIEAELKELSRIVIEALPQPKDQENNVTVKNNMSSSRLYDVAEEPIDNCQNDNLRPRSILKNHRRSFILGETDDGIKTKPPGGQDRSAGSPIPESTPVWRSTVTLRNKRYDDFKKRNDDDKKLYSSDGETELQIRIRNLRRTDTNQRKLWENSSFNSHDRKSESPKRRSLPDDILLKHSLNPYGNTSQKMTISTEEMPSLSVAERIKQVEELKSNNYSTKINFRSGEMTVVQNGTTNVDKYYGEDIKKPMTTWANQKKMPEIPSKEDKRSSLERPLLSCDKLTTSNPPVMRFSTHDDKTDNQKYQTTRILINFESSAKGESPQTETSSSEKLNKNNSNKTSGRLINTYGSWSSGMKKDLGRYLNDLKSTSLVKETIQVPQGDNPELNLRENIPKPFKPVHEIIDQFDSLSVPSRNLKEKRRKTMPIVYKPPKEYTHSDLEEELKNFTENLDKDFRDIYEEEIGSLRKSKSLKETKITEPESPPRIENIVRPVILRRPGNYFPTKSSSDEGSKKSSQRTSSRDNYDTDDSDLLADEEVRSYMSTGHGGSDSETEDAYGSSSSRKSFEDSILRFKKLESQIKGNKEIKNNIAPIQPATRYPESISTRKTHGINDAINDQPRVASIALKYEDDPYFSKTTYKNSLKVPKPYNGTVSSNEVTTEVWDRTSNSSSTVSNKPRERVSYLNSLSLSEKYSKYLQRSSNSSLETASESNVDKISKRMETDPQQAKPDDYLLRGKSDSEVRPYKCKYSSRNTLNVYSRGAKQIENIKEEKVMKEEPKSHRYSLRSGSDNVDVPRHRVKPSSEKETSIRKSSQVKYQSHCQHSEKKVKERDETDAVIIEELKKAADQILMAVNGYTDDSSHVGSSEDDDRSRRIIRKDKISNLGTISEGKRVTKTELRRNMTTSTSKRTTGKESSASSLESLTKESIRTTRECKSSSRHKHESGKPLSSRTTRLLQRASSREALMPQPSSSEDIPSYLEQAKKRVVRRQKSSSSSVKAETPDAKTSSSRLRSKSKATDSTATSRAKERKPEKSKESTSMTRNSRSSHTPDGERTKSSSRRTVVEKTDADAIRKRRSQHTSSREEHATAQTHRKKATAVRKPEGTRTSQPT